MGTLFEVKNCWRPIKASFFLSILLGNTNKTILFIAKAFNSTPPENSTDFQLSQKITHYVIQHISIYIDFYTHLDNTTDSHLCANALGSLNAPLGLPTYTYAHTHFISIINYANIYTCSYFHVCLNNNK